MRQDNMFYAEARKLLLAAHDSEQEPETVSYEELYERWLLPTLLATPPLKSYPKSLVDFAELILASPRGDMEWFDRHKDHAARSVLGRSLQSAATGEKRKYSAVAMAFAGYKFEVGYVAQEDPRGTAAMCHELIAYMGWVPEYFQIDPERQILRGTKKLQRESRLPVWLPSESIW